MWVRSRVLKSNPKQALMYYNSLFKILVVTKISNRVYKSTLNKQVK